jgi:chitin disaccharide deacetylase
MLKHSLLLCALVWAVATLRVAAQSTAERLGYGPNDKVLIVHADDVGMSHNVNVATIDALKKGMVTSASIMVPCPWFPEIAAYAKQHPELDFGLHLTLTSEWRTYRWRPVAPVDKVPGLLDAEGFMWRSERMTAQKATPQEVETELRAQIERALAFGLKPTHLDTHMGALYARPDFFDVYAKLGREYGIPIMAMRPTPELEAMAKLAGIPITSERLRKLDADGFALLDYLSTGVRGKGYEERRRAYHEFLKNLKPGVTMLIVHLGLDVDELKAITNSWADRHADYRVFTEPETQALMGELGIKLTTWRDLGRLAWKDKKQPTAGQ